MISISYFMLWNLKIKLILCGDLNVELRENSTITIGAIVRVLALLNLIPGDLTLDFPKLNPCI